MNVPKLRFKEFNDEYKKVKFGDIVNYQKGFAFKSKDYKNSGVRIIRISDTTNNSIKKNNAIYINKEEAVKHKNVELITDDIMISSVGSKPPLYDSMVGKVVLIPEFINGSLLNQNAIRFRTKQDNQKYIYNYLKQRKYTRFIENIMRGNANQRSITLEDLFEFELNIPSLNEQNKVSKLLSLLNKKIKLQSKKIEDLKLFKKGLLKKNYYKIANNNLTELSCIANIYQPQTISQSELDNGKYHVFGANGIIGKYSKFNHKFMQVTISCRGENSGTINLTPDECWITGNSMVLNVDENKNVDKLYLKSILEAQNLKYLISGSGQPQIVRSSVLKHKIPYISIEQQKKFTIPFIKLDSKIKLEQNKLIKLQKLKKGLMQRMFV
jgi:type I restriction enzyme S subunit